MARKSKAPRKDKATARAGAEDSGPEAIRRGMRVVAEATGTAPPEAGSLPSVDVRGTISQTASAVGMVLHGAPLFKFAGEMVTVDESTGNIEPMAPERFVSWVEDHLAFVKWSDAGARPESIGKDTAGKLLAADRLRAHVRELKAVNPVRLPVWHGKGEERAVVLAPPGHDSETGILTLDSVAYPEDMPFADAFLFLKEHLKRFPFETEGIQLVEMRRSFTVLLAAMLGVYCRALFAEGTAKPMVVINGNQPGTGKSLLVRMILSPVHGDIPEAGKPDGDTEFEKLLDSAAMSRKPFLVLDDVHSLKSQALNRFITSPTHECRRMYSQKLESVPKVTQVFATGNGLVVTEDLDRRALIVDLFDPGKSTARKFTKEITNEWLVLPETRTRFLAAAWAFVRDWAEAGSPGGKGRKPSFERWAEVVGGIYSHHFPKLAGPFAQRDVSIGGDESGRALERVFELIAGEMEPGDPPVKTDEVLERAEDEGLLETIVGYGIKDAKKALGWRVKRLKGRHFIDTRKRKFEFGKRDSMTGASYPVTFLDPEE